MTTLSKAAKAAAVKYYVMEDISSIKAAELYDALEATESEDALASVFGKYGLDILSVVESSTVSEIWEFIRSLARSIDQCREELEQQS